MGGIFHSYTQTVADGTATSVVRPSDWNSGHAYTIQDGVSLAGNTAGVLAAIVAGTLYLAGGNNVTLSQNANSVTISGAAAGGTAISGIVGSNTTYTSGTVAFTGVGGGVTVSSNTGQRIDISVAAPVAQTNQSLAIYGSNNTTGQSSSSTYDARSLSLVGDGIVSVGWSAGSLRISATAAAQSAQSAIQGLGASNTGNTAGNTGVSTGINWVLAGSGNVTISESTSAGGPNTLWVSVNTQGYLANVYASNNTFSTSSGTADIRTLSIAGSGAVYVAASNSGWIISAATQTPQSAIQAFGASNTGNTAGNTGVSTGINWILAGTNNITISESTSAGGPNTLWVSGPTVGGAQTGISGIVVSDTTYTSGTVSFSNQNGVTIGSSANGATQYIRLSVATNYQSQAAYLTTAALSGDTTKYLENWKLTGNTAGTTSSAQGTDFWLAGGNGVTVSGSSNTISISVATNYQSQAAYLTTADLSANSSNYLAAWALTGNTAGTTSSAQGTKLWLAGGNNITLSGSSNSITIVGGAGGGGLGGLVVTNTTYTSGTVYFSNLANVTITSSVNGASQYAQFSVAAQTNQTGSVYASSNTFGTSSGSYDARTLSMAGAGAISIAASNSGWVVSSPVTSSLSGVSPVALVVNGSTISVSLNQISQLDPFPATALVTNSTLGQSSLYFYPVDIEFPVSASRLNVFLSIATTFDAASSATSGSGSLGYGYALYTNNAQTLSLLTSYSLPLISYTGSSGSRFGATFYAGLSNATSHTTSTTALSTSNASTFMLNSLGGFRVVALPLGLSLTPGRYWFGFSQQSTANNGASYAIKASVMQQTLSNQLAFMVFGTSSAASNASFYALSQGVGTYSAQSAAWPASIALTTNAILAGVAAVQLPFFNLSGFTTSTNYL